MVTLVRWQMVLTYRNIPTATLNNRLEEAQVVAPFAGEVNDEILALEFKNCGQNYTDADYTFIGSWYKRSSNSKKTLEMTLCLKQELLQAQAAAAGGGGFTLIGNNAQTGDELTVTIATNDDNEEANLLGLRIILTSVPVQDSMVMYMHTTVPPKVVTVYKESMEHPVGI